MNGPILFAAGTDAERSLLTPLLHAAAARGVPCAWWNAADRAIAPDAALVVPVGADGALTTAAVAVERGLDVVLVEAAPTTAGGRARAALEALAALRLELGGGEPGLARALEQLLRWRRGPAADELPQDGDHSGRTLGDEELILAVRALRSGTLNSTRGTFVAAFERGFAARMQRRHAVACSSGSAAIHCAIAALGLQPGDEVITTPITDMGAIVPILYEGALPVFCDVDADTLNVTAATIRAALTPRTRAVIATHLFGRPCAMREIAALCAEHDLWLIEDVAQAFLAEDQGRLCGTFGDIACWSLQQGKHITTGEGGMVATDDPALARRLFLCVNKAWGYGDARPDHTFPAHNFRLTELQGAVGLAQLGKLDGAVARRRQLAARLHERLAGVPGLRLPLDPAGGAHSYWKYPLLVDGERLGDAGSLGTRIQRAGVACVPRYIQKPAFECELFHDWHRSPVTRLPWQASARAGAPQPLFVRDGFPGAIAALQRVIVLPLNERYRDDHVDHVAQVIAAQARALVHA